jgi:7TMR-DISM extracellular 2
MLSKGYSASAFWVRLKVEGSSPEEGLPTDKLRDKLILRIQPAYLDDIRLFDPLEPSGQECSCEWCR